MRSRFLFGWLALAAGLAGCAGAPPVEVGSPREPAVGVSPVPVPAPLPAPPAEIADNEAPPRLEPADNIFFRAGATQLDPAEQSKLPAHARRLKADPRQVVTLAGHTDDQGSRSYNLAIAEGRVEAVFGALRRMGVPARQLQRYPVGREKTRRGCTTAECRQSMRRVELVYRP
jgi:OOP family OmpA-OmpF porin